LLFAATVIFAQSLTGQLIGTVNDENRARLGRLQIR
jgi:hypothetical protein